MPMTDDEVIEEVHRVKGFHDAERDLLKVLYLYYKGDQALPGTIPSTAPLIVKELARIARVNVCQIVVDALVQSMFVDGFRAKDDDEDSETWGSWQANRMDAAQTAIHRATCIYGTGYGTVLPGHPLPVIRGYSPMKMTALYGDNPDWPVVALERRDGGRWRLFDNEAIYDVAERPKTVNGIVGDEKALVVTGTRTHGLGVTPVVRYRDQYDLDAGDIASPNNEKYALLGGQVAPLIRVQDQINETTFGLLVAQHYAAFRQRYILGWVAKDEAELLKAGAAKIMTLDVDARETKVGEFEQTELDGYIKSREASLRHAASLSQTPAHELIGELINLSAEALAAAEAGRDRKVDELQTLMGEAHEQLFWLVGKLQGVTVPDDAQVRWRNTSARAVGAEVDALGKLAQMLGIPPQELWERVPGATRQDVERWKAAAQTGDPFDDLARLLKRQATQPAGALNGAQ